MGDLKTAIMMLARSGPAGQPVPKQLMSQIIRHAEYTPVSPEACECGLPKKRPGKEFMSSTITWKRCTLLGQVDGNWPYQHVRVGSKDYFTSYLGMRRCTKVR